MKLNNSDVIKKKEYNYQLLDENGLIYEGLHVKDNDVVIAK